MRVSRPLTFVAASFIAIGVLAQTPEVKDAPPKKWVCTVPSHAQLISYSYDGGNWANIHLAPYSSGGSYRVTKSGAEATGTTGNGTPFTGKQE